MMNTIETLDNQVFKTLITTIGVLPTSFIDSMSYYEMIAWLVNYIKTEVIPAINNNAEAVKEIQHWIETLDLQDEVNNKLDEMAESGELTEIIAQYLSLGAVIAYETIADMVAAENLTNGSICRVLGNTNYATGDGAFYRVRALINTDVVDGVNLVAITAAPTLVAERIPDAGLNAANTEIASLDTRLDNIEAKKTMIVIGDSYSNDAQSGSPLWYTYIAKWDNLNVYTTASDGQGYATGNNNFLTQLQNAKTNATGEIDRIYILGGLNDIGDTTVTTQAFEAAINSTLTYATTNFPDAKIYVIGIMPFQFYNTYANYTPLDAYRTQYFCNYLSYVSNNYANVIFRSAQFFGLNIADFFGSENAYKQAHPSAFGEKCIANFIYNGNAIYGMRQPTGANCPFINTPLVCSNGTATIHSVSDIAYEINIANYDNTAALDLYFSNIPSLVNYAVVTDEAGHSNFVYLNGNKFTLGASSGLNSGTIYLTIPATFNS